ncbi:hypothetical protein ACRJ4B_42530, partial [Streptomyces sp. GTA36]
MTAPVARLRYELLTQVGPLQRLVQQRRPYAVGGGHEQDSFECLAGAQPVGPPVVSGGQHGDCRPFLEGAGGQHGRVPVSAEVPHRDLFPVVLRPQRLGWHPEGFVVGFVHPTAAFRSLVGIGCVAMLRLSGDPQLTVGFA